MTHMHARTYARQTARTHASTHARTHASMHAHVHTLFQFKSACLPFVAVHLSQHMVQIHQEQHSKGLLTSPTPQPFNLKIPLCVSQELCVAERLAMYVWARTNLPEQAEVKHEVWRNLFCLVARKRVGHWGCPVSRLKGGWNCHHPHFLNILNHSDHHHLFVSFQITTVKGKGVMILYCLLTIYSGHLWEICVTTVSHNQTCTSHFFNLKLLQRQWGDSFKLSTEIILCTEERWI